MYKLEFVGFCGMPYDIATDLELNEARDKIAALIQEKRNAGYTVNVLEKDAEWGFIEPDDARLVPDDAGYLSLINTDARLPKCDHCGKPCRKKYINSESNWTGFEFCSEYCAEEAMSPEEVE